MFPGGIDIVAGDQVSEIHSAVDLGVKEAGPLIFDDRFELGPNAGCGPANDTLPAGPLNVAEFFFTGAPLDGNSFDLTFSSVGALLVRDGDNLVAIDIDGNVNMVPVSEQLPATLGLRLGSSGELLAAAFFESQILGVESSGTVTTYWDEELLIPYALFPTRDGGLFLTDFQVPLVGYIPPGAGELVTLVQGADFAATASGILHDPDRERVFYLSYDLGLLYGLDVTNIGEPGKPQLLYDLAADEPDVRLSGLAMDICGHLYVVDQNQGGPGALYRFELDVSGTAVVAVTKLATDFPAGIANCVFAEGPSWDAYETTLFCVGLPGVIYTVDVGVQGAPTAISSHPSRRFRPGYLK